MLFSDEKWFVRVPHPNRQNERYCYWAPHDTEVKTNNRNQGESKVMCWARFVDDTMILPWFEEGNKSVTGDTYMQMLK